MKKKLEGLVKEALIRLIESGKLPEIKTDNIQITTTPNRDFGDFATNIAMIAASEARMPPRKIAELITGEMSGLTEIFNKVETAGPGFVNFYLNPKLWTDILLDIHKQGDDFGKSAYGAGKKVQVEFVSANPTGPLHVGHGRGAAVGDTLVRILNATGFDAQAEYYINDLGNQMNTLGRSVLARYRQLFGIETEFPEEGYKGDYIRDLAEELKEAKGDSLLDTDDAITACRDFASKRILDGIKKDLERFNVHFDNWFSESTLYDEDKIVETIDGLRKKDLIYEDEGALWFRSSNFGDEKDRVVKKQDGSLTYFTPDIAYHSDKMDRGFKKIIDIWGADHHGYVPRMTAAIEALGADSNCFQALLIQMVSLVRSGKPVYMSTRAGEFITLREIIDEVGTDAARYFFLMRKCDSQLVFDLELAKKKSEENPVFYIQYAHARICSILRNAAQEGLDPDINKTDLSILTTDDELDLIKQLASYPDMLVSCAKDMEPHRISFYLLDLATSFHRFYNRNRVIADNPKVTDARIILIIAVSQVIRNALTIMGINAPQSM